MSDNTSETMDRLRLNNADDIAVLLEEHLRIEDGHIEGKPYVAVKIAEEYEAEIDRIDAFTRLFLQKAEDEIEQLRHMNRTMFKRDEGQRAEIERLNAKADTWITTAGQNAEAADRLAAEIERLRTALVEAKEAVQSWGAYADKYFQEKWDLAGDIKAIDGALAPQQEPKKDFKPKFMNGTGYGPDD